MSTLSPSNPGSDPGPSPELQFERAEYAGGHSGPSCSTCKQPVGTEYHQLNGRVFCTSCRAKVEQAIERLRQSGSLARSALYGFGAAVLGALIYYAVSAATGYEFGLIAVVVGLLVGKAVRKGSGSIGGPKYQALAMILTYFAISATYVPGITKGYLEQAAKRENVQTQAAGQSPPVTPPKAVHIGVVPFYAFMFALSLALPVLAGISNILGTIIMGIGLWEAWKFNRRVPVTFTGPFSVAGPQPSPGA